MRFGRANVMGDVSGVTARGVSSAAKERNGGIGGGDWSDNAAPGGCRKGGSRS